MRGLPRYVQAFGHAVDEKQPFLEVLQPQRWEMLAVKDLLERYAKVRSDTPCRRRLLRLRRRRMGEAVGKREKGVRPKFDGLRGRRGTGGAGGGGRLGPGRHEGRGTYGRERGGRHPKSLEGEEARLTSNYGGSSMQCHVRRRALCIRRFAARRCTSSHGMTGLPYDPLPSSKTWPTALRDSMTRYGAQPKAYMAAAQTPCPPIWRVPRWEISHESASIGLSAHGNLRALFRIICSADELLNLSVAARGCGDLLFQQPISDAAGN